MHVTIWPASGKASKPLQQALPHAPLSYTLCPLLLLPITHTHTHTTLLPRLRAQVMDADTRGVKLRYTYNDKTMNAEHWENRDSRNIAPPFTYRPKGGDYTPGPKEAWRLDLAVGSELDCLDVVRPTCGVQTPARAHHTTPTYRFVLPFLPDLQVVPFQGHCSA